MIVAVIVLAIAAVLVTSCKKDPKRMTPVEVVEAAYNAYVAKDFVTFFSYYDMEPDLQAAWAETMTTKADSDDFNGIVDFSIKGSDVKEDTATVNVWTKFKDGTINDTNQDLVKTPDGWKMKWIDK